MQYLSGFQTFTANNHFLIKLLSCNMKNNSLLFFVFIYKIIIVYFTQILTINSCYN